MISIKQGDAFSMPVEVKLNKEPVEIANVAEVEFMFGDVRKTYPADATYNTAEQCFYVPLTQKDTFSFPADEVIQLDIRVGFVGGTVIGIGSKIPIYVYDATSEAVLNG